MHEIHNGDCAEVMASMGDDSVDARSNDDPIFVVKLMGILRPEDLERYARKFSEELPGRVVVVDNRVEDIYRMTRLDVERLVMMLEETADD